MAHFKIDQKFVESIMGNLKERGCDLSLEQVELVVDIIRDEVLYQYIDHLVSQVDAIPFEDTIAGEVVRTHRSYFVPNIMNEEKYRNKENVEKLGIHSMLAVPISIPRFSLKDLDTEGVLQIYYEEREKDFTPLEAKIAELFSRRVSHVIARRRIMDLQKMNATKDKIVEKDFMKLGRREGIKMKDVFNLIIPELIDIMRIQRCSLFAVLEDRQHVVLEAGFPEVHHGIGQIFSVQEP